MTTVEAPRVKPVTLPVETPKKQIVMPFQVTPKRQDRPRPLLQPKYDISVMSKPNFNKCLGKFIPSEAKMMGLKSKENAEELHFRYLPGYRDKRMGGDNYLNSTESSKIAAFMAMKLMGEHVAIQATLETSFDNDEWMSVLICQVK